MTSPTLSREERIGYLCVVVAVALFSTFTLASKAGLQSSLMPHELALLRFGCAGLLLLPVFVRRGLGPVSPLQALRLALLGGLGFALAAYHGFRLAPVSHGSVLLHGTLTLMTFVVVSLAQRAEVVRGRWAGLLVVLVGVVAMAADSLRGASAAQLGGDALLLLASLCWSAYAVSARRLGLDALHAAAIVATLSLLCFAPACLFFADAPFRRAAPAELLWQALVQGLLMGVVSILVYTRAVRALGAERTSQFTAAIPVLTTVLGAALLGERPSAVAWAGVGTVTLGMVLMVRGQGGVK